MELSNDFIPLRRPHFHLRDESLYFMISSRPYAKLDNHDISLWNIIDGKTQASEVSKSIPDAKERLKRFWAKGICEFLPLSFPDNRRKILVFEPHMDDAILSMGGTIWANRNQCEFVVISLIGISVFTSYTEINRDYFDINTVTELRKKETSTVMNLLGGKHIDLGYLDAPLRYYSGQWTTEWHIKNRRALSAFINRSPAVDELKSWSSSVRKVLKKEMEGAAEIWIPLAIGTSTDHESTRNACLRALMDDLVPLAEVEVYFYQDVPYANQFPYHTRQIIEAFHSAGGVLEPVYHDITQSIEDKLRLISIFGSQFKLSYMGPKVKECGKLVMESDKKYGEMRLKIRRFPEKIDELELYSGYKYVIKILDQLKKWYPRNSKAKKIRILCPMGVGGLKEDITNLLEFFPNAKLILNIASDTIEETNGLVLDRLEVIPVEPNKSAWVKRILKVLIEPPCPTILLTHVKFEYLSAHIKLLYIYIKPLLATTMDHLVLALKIYNKKVLDKNMCENDKI